MADEETSVDKAKADVSSTGSDDANIDNTKKDDAEKEDNRPDDTLAEKKTCPECDAPVDDVRATCINCGYEYKEEDHEDLDAGSEFTSGSQIDEEGNELPQEESGEGEESGEES